MRLQPEFCAGCGEPLDPKEIVVQIIDKVNVVTEQQDEPIAMDGSTDIFHPNHLPAPNGWREIYRGPLSGIRPGATT